MSKQKIIILSLILTCWSVSFSSAQLFTFGLKGGVSSSKLAFDQVQVNGLRIQQGESVLAWHAGIFTRISILGFHVQPELYYAKKGGKVDFQGGSSSTTATQFHYHQFDLPVLVGYKFLGLVRAQAGPVFSFTVDNKVKGLSGVVSGLEENYKNATIGYQLGLGLDLFRFTIDARYEGDLSKLGSSVTLPGGQKVNTDFRNKQFVFSLGYKLIK